MTNENLWDFGDENIEKKTDSIIGIMKTQSVFLKEGTKGKVFGRFGKIKDISALSSIKQIAQALSHQETSIVDEFSDDIDISMIDEEGKYEENIKDANELFETKRYGFEIYNKNYKFRLFEMNLRPIYPIELFIDEGILDDDTLKMINSIATTNEKNGSCLVYTEEEYKDCLKFMFTSRKVRFIIDKMSSLNSD